MELTVVEEGGCTFSSICGRCGWYVDSIWENSSCQQYNIGKVGPYVLTVESVKFLQTTLSDEVLDAYLHLLTQSRNVFHISSVVMTAIFMDNREIHSLLRKETLCGYEYCIGAVNQGGNHWTLMLLVCPR
ncbi:uncharacterized protein LOC128246056 [Mya arenaria]|uniref:uncharacterized protein LOC128246056 n=1 Tax=Mya arenaria TaxID=6604 RepID=UPI0022E6D8A6|nr:uncharacterized protein LOC128246056 [Mya arenaria]